LSPNWFAVPWFLDGDFQRSATVIATVLLVEQGRLEMKGFECIGNLLAGRDVYIVDANDINRPFVPVNQTETAIRSAQGLL
jgi:hypothetical protein